MDSVSKSHSRRAIAQELAHGWRLLLGATLGVALGISALPFYTFGMFMRAIETDLHWRRSEIALAQTSWAIVLALMSPVVGALIDRVGHRLPIAASFVGLVLSFTLLGTLVASPLAFIAVYTLMAVTASASSPLPFAKLVAANFTRARGIALGITLTGTGLSALIASRYLGKLVEQAGWQAGYLALALVVAILGPLSYWLISARAPVAATSPSKAAADGIRISRALRTGVFWQLAAIFFLVTFAASGLVAHLVPILTAAGATPSAAASIVGIVGISVIAGRLTIGALIDLLPVRYVAAGAFLLTATGCFLILHFGTAFAWTTALGVGFALGAEVDLMGYCTARYFGFHAYGSIYGAQYGLTIVGVAISPVWMALLEESRGYDSVLSIATIITLTAAMLCLALPRSPSGLRSYEPIPSDPH